VNHLAGRRAHTYSIVARDPDTGEMGVAVQSHWFSVGSVVSWAKAGVGAVATQSLVEISFGPRGLALLEAGRSAPQALHALIESDEGRAVRQLAIIDAQGAVAAHTGARCIPEAGHIVDENFSVQANMMLSSSVWPAMAEAYRSHPGLPLAERMVAALEAAQAAGGDIRGQQSAALLVVRGESTGKEWEDRLIDLRVEDHTQPVVELKRLLQVHRAYEHMNRGDQAMEANDMAAALHNYRAAETLFPDNLEMKYWHAVALANRGWLDEALPLFSEVFQRDPNWRTMTARLPGQGFLTVSETDLQRILGAHI